MTQIELNAILYYADFLSLKAENKPVTDNCKYFFVNGAPINALYIIDLEPEYDRENPYLIQSYQEYQVLEEKYEEDGALSFIDDICSLKACGSVDAEMMLKCIHQYSTKYERKMAFNAYKNWKKEQAYTHITLNEDGNPQRTECTQYVKHAETGLARRGLLKSPGYNGENGEYSL